VQDLLLFIAVLAVLILGHELGHFLVARAWKIRIEEFGLGFPPRIATLFVAGGTRFTLNAIPLGGFVRPTGEDDSSVPGGLAGAPRLARATVLLAGPGANLVLAFLAFTTAFKFASPDPSKVLITAVSPGSPAAQAGLQQGDRVVDVQGTPVTSIDVLRSVVASHLDTPIDLTVSRAGSELFVTMTARGNPPPGEGPIGVTLGNPARTLATTEAVRAGWIATRDHFLSVLRLPGQWLRGELRPEDTRITGLKGMYDLLVWAGDVDRAAQRPFVTLNFIGFLSASLALANLLPIPALDGGRLLFLGLEVVIGRRISSRTEGWAHAVGYALLIGLMLYVNLQDFVNPIPLPH
jgi:regulator of sigma E protease